MQDMRDEMCGGAVVLAAMQGVAREKPPGLNIVALVPATDNMSGSAAIKPGDIITHYNGKTSEVINTDAEDHLILADALAYGIKKYKPDAENRSGACRSALNTQNSLRRKLLI